MARPTSEQALASSFSSQHRYRSASKMVLCVLRKMAAFARRERTSLNSGERGSSVPAASTLGFAPERGVRMEVCASGSKGIPSRSAICSMSLKGPRVVRNTSTVCWKVCCCSSRCSQLLIRLFVRPVTSACAAATSSRMSMILWETFTDRWQAASAPMMLSCRLKMLADFEPTVPDEEEGAVRESLHASPALACAVVSATVMLPWILPTAASESESSWQRSHTDFTIAASVSRSFYGWGV
mmetsp:Transcript_33060/g.72819  ORF Transcript_33060/g.72819 Transcript_33060/m.72819 type:complete len:240 (-) Transcript_33060:15-734(-)